MITLVKQLFTPRQAINSICRTFEAEVHKKNLTLVTDISCDLVLSADINRIGQVLVNILSNAIKFTSHGSIKISCSHTKLPDDMIKLDISVTDTGCGIAEANIRHLFNRFEQSTQRTTLEYGSGSGLGLFISKNLVRLLGGEITCESEWTRGSRFSFYVMCTKANETAQDQYRLQSSAPLGLSNSVNKSKLRPIRALVVQDNMVNQHVLTQMLQQEGCVCITANDGVQALYQVTHNPLDIIFMDIAMPNMDGFECTRKIRELEIQNQAAKVTIIGVSGNVREEYRTRGLELGMTQYLYTPITRHNIAEQLATIRLKKGMDRSL
jgi:CheY-like chemotaxis protein/anti-sigma regulatory factor (Ser/Thr protein kinase)